MGGNMDNMARDLSVEAQLAITDNGASAPVKYHGASALDMLVYIASGTGSFQLEISIDGQTQWIPVGAPCTETCMVRHVIPEGVYVRVVTTAAAALSATVALLDE